MNLPLVQRTLAGAIAVLLAVALFAAGVGVGRSDKPAASVAPPPPTTAALPGEPAVAVTTVVPAPAPPPPAPAAGPTFEASARSVAYQGTVVDLASVKVRGTTDISVSGEVFDASGASKGQGHLTVRGSDLALAGTGLGLTLGGELRLAGRTAKIVGQTGFTGFTVATTTRLGVSAADITFRPSNDQQSTPTAMKGPVGIVPFAGKLEVRSSGTLDWADPPAALRLSTGSERTTLSWAGVGVIRANGANHRAGHLGLKALSLTGTIERAGSGFRLTGDGEVLQVYADGLPKLAAQGQVRLKSLPGRVPRGTRAWFTWAPENDGRTDMANTPIRPANAEAHWVSLGLDGLPAMCGNDTCPRRGGDTTGFTDGKPINAVIIPGTGDERDISFRVPADAALGRRQIVIVVEGNFEPIRVVVDFEVVEPPPPTTTSR